MLAMNFNLRKSTIRLMALAVLVTVLCAAAAGQDSYGYKATSSVPYSYINIAPTGTAVLASTDDGTAVLNLPFPFLFYGNTYTSLCVSTNGLVAFGGCPVGDMTNLDLTSQSPSGNLPLIAPFWMDLSFASSGAGAVVYQTMGAAPSRQFVIQWNNVFGLNAPGALNFQAILNEGANTILFQYQSVESADTAVSKGAGATVGIRGASGDVNQRRVQWSYKAPVLGNSQSILFSPQPATPFNLGTAGPQNWAVLGLGSPTNLTMSGSSVITGAVANVGIAASGNVVMSGSGRIDGQLWLNTAGTLTKSGTTVIAGGVVKTAAGDAALLQAAADARAASAAAAALQPTIQTSSTIVLASKTMTITGGPGVNVVSVTSVTIANGVLTLSAPAGATFVVNISGSLTLSGGTGSIKLAGGLTPPDVLFNITGTGSVTMSGGSVSNAQFSGILLAPKASVTLAPPSLVGELITGGAAVTISGSGQIRNP